MTAWRHAVALGALVLMAGCGTATEPDRDERPGETTLGTDLRSLDPSGTEIEDTGGVTGKQGPTINLGTARLDGSSGDEKPWALFNFYLGDRPRIGCRLFTWAEETTVPVTVVDIVFSNDTVQLGPVGERCRTDKPACRGFTFPASTESEPTRRTACAASVIAKASEGRVQTTVTFILRTTCTAATAKPCDDRRVAGARPSRGNPVGVEWRYSETLTTVTHPCRKQDSDESGTCPTDAPPPASSEPPGSSAPPVSSVPPAPSSPPSSR